MFEFYMFIYNSKYNEGTQIFKLEPGYTPILMTHTSHNFRIFLRSSLKVASIKYIYFVYYMEIRNYNYLNIT